MSDTIAKDPALNADAVLERLAAAQTPRPPTRAHSPPVPRPDPDPAESVSAPVDARPEISDVADADEVLAFLDAHQNASEPATDPTVPRGSADLLPRKATGRRTRKHISPTAQHGHGRPAALLLGIVGLAVAVVLGVSQIATTSARSPAAHDADQISAETSQLASTQVSVLDFGAISSQVDVSVPRLSGAARVDRATLTTSKHAKRKVTRRTVTHPVAPVAVTSTPPAPVAVTPTPNTDPAPTASSSSTSTSSDDPSPVTLKAELGGIVGKNCNPTCK